MTKKIYLFIILFIPLISEAQYFSTGQDPASVKWRQIKTGQYRLIFPDKFEEKAVYFSNVLDLLTSPETKTLTAKVPRIPVILHTQSSVSNGITTWAPRRIELYPCPPQDMYPEEWLEQLGIHEYRHAVQVSKLNQGFTRALYYIFGEQATGAVLGLFIPPWFLEGDAVCTETALTSTGRGRTSAFENILRAQILEKKIYKYDKAVLGSYRTFIPDQYALGYPLVAQTRKTFGTKVWNTALNRSARLPFMVVPFSSGIHKETGLSKTKLYRQMLGDLRNDWQNQYESTSYTDYRLITKKDPKDFLVYNHPVMMNDSTIIAEKESLNYPDRIVMINRKTGKEKKLLTLGPSADESISVAENTIVWTEFRPHSRWQNKDYSVIRMYDVSTKKVKTITRRARYFAPFLSPDGKKIATIEISPELLCAIVILDASSGLVLQKIAMEKNQLAMTPNWSPEGNELVFTLLTEKGKTISVIDLSTLNIKTYLPFSYTEISGPAYFHNQHLIFASDYSGIQNLYAVDTLTRKVSQVCSAKFSSSDPSFTSDMKTMIYSDYCSDGNMIAETDIDTLDWIPLGKVRNFNIRLYDTLASQEKTNIQDSVIARKIYKMYGSSGCDMVRDTIAGTVHPVRKYSKILNVFKPHSWAPLSFDVNNLTLHPGVMVLSQNVLSSAIASAGFDYDINEETGKFYANLSYQGLYPVFDFTFSIGNRAGLALVEPTRETVRFLWQETNFSATISIPWNFSLGKFSRYLTPSIGTTLINVKHLASTPENFTSGLIQTMDYNLTYSQYLRSVPKDIYPRWGQVFHFNFRNSPFTKNNMGSIWESDLTLYFPGIVRHHSLWMYGGYQERPETGNSNYRYGDFIAFPRGYSELEDESVYSLMFNYSLPLFYPDWSAGSVLYFKRFKLNLFFDYSEGFNKNKITDYQSTGAELTADLHILRFLYPFELGVRTIFLPYSSTWQFEFLYAIRY